MKSIFNETTFKNFVTLQRGFDLPKQDRKEGEFPIVASTAVQGYHAEYKVKPPGVITGRSGSLGSVQYLDKPFWPLNTTLWVKNFKGNNPKFTYYFLKTLRLERYNSGAGVPTLNRNHLDALDVAIPPLPTQRKIAAILSAYDDLIENNLRRIKILEEMAQNLYREWFVKFRFPGHEQARFVDSPLGRIPEGWEVKALGELILGHIGGGWGSDVETDKHTEPAWVIRGTDIPEGRVCNFSKVPFRYHSMSNLKSRRLKPGDIVFEVSGGSKGQPLGRTLLISSELIDAFHGETVMCASFCKRIEPDTKQYAPEILYLSLLEAYESGEIEQYQVQSTGISNFKWSDYLEKVYRCVPPVALQLSFCALSAPLFSKVAIIGRTNNNLRRTRDMLLPKLISGEIDVSELAITLPEEVAA